MTHLVSIIVPIYKVEPYLRRCLDSIVNQTYTNLEIILVDDGSPDKCPQICEEYAKIDKRIIVIHKENGGLSDARNAGLDRCSGEYISFVDSDDIISVNSIQMMMKLAKEDVLVISNIKKFNGEDYLYRNRLEITGACTTYSSDELLITLCKEDPTYLRSVCGKIFHKKYFSNLRFAKGKLYEDMYINYLLYNSIPQAIFINVPLYYYRCREGSITSNTTQSTFAIEADELRYHFLKEQGKNAIIRYCLPHLCWDYLLLYAQKQHNAKTKFLYYVKEYFSNKPTVNIHFILLRIFATAPFLYRFLRALSPWHIREQ